MTKQQGGCHKHTLPTNPVSGWGTTRTTHIRGVFLTLPLKTNHNLPTAPVPFKIHSSPFLSLLKSTLDPCWSHSMLLHYAWWVLWQVTTWAPQVLVGFLLHSVALERVAAHLSWSTVPICTYEAPTPFSLSYSFVFQNKVLHIHKISPILHTTTLKMEAACTSEIFTTLSRTTWCNNWSMKLTSTINNCESLKLFVYT